MAGTGKSQAEVREAISYIGEEWPAFFADEFLNELRYIRCAPTKSGRNIPITVVTLDADIAEYWHKQIQPIAKEMTTRADANWSWPAIYKWASLGASLLRQGPTGFALMADFTKEFGVMIPVSLVQMAQKYPHLTDHGVDSSFIWFLSDAPENALLALNDPTTGESYFQADTIPKLLGTLALDTGIISTYFAGNRGRLGLKASPAGGQGLFDWYLKQGMINIDESIPLPWGLRRVLSPNDGRYFCYNEGEALTAAERADPYR